MSLFLRPIIDPLSWNTFPNFFRSIKKVNVPGVNPNSINLLFLHEIILQYIDENIYQSVMSIDSSDKVSVVSHVRNQTVEYHLPHNHSMEPFLFLCSNQNDGSDNNDYIELFQFGCSYTFLRFILSINKSYNCSCVLHLSISFSQIYITS